MQGAYGHAAALHREALASLQSTLGDDHPNVGVMHYSVAAALLMMGRYDEALQHAEQARRIGVLVHGEHSVPAATDLSLIGEIQLRAGRLDEAEATLRDAVADLEAAEPDEQRRHAFFRSQLGQVLSERGERDEALALLEKSLADQEQLYGQTDEYVAETLGHLADLRLRLDADPASASALAERSLTIYDQVPTNPQVKAGARFRLARALWATGDAQARTRATTLATEAAEMLRPVDADPKRLEEIEAWLSQRANEPTP
jgi:tetratricopeptide (TPR) repeat protein